MNKTEHDTDEPRGRASLFMTLSMLALYLFAAASLLVERLGALAAGDLGTWLVALVLLSPLVGYASVLARRGGVK